MQEKRTLEEELEIIDVLERCGYKFTMSILQEEAKCLQVQADSSSESSESEQDDLVANAESEEKEWSKRSAKEVLRYMILKNHVPRKPSQNVVQSVSLTLI